jgi:threonine dehydratase
MAIIPDFNDVVNAAELIRPHIHPTRLITSKALNQMTGAELFFKPENLQRTGSFKARGGCNAVFSLTPDEARRGVATHSSGNHAQAVAYAAALRGIPATIVMPRNAPPVKVAAVRDYGARIVWAGDHPLDRERELEAVLEASGAVFIHPSNDPRVIAGQGTAALELLNAVAASSAGPLDLVMTPVGGGGLLAGTALTVAARGEGARTIGVEPLAVDDAYRSLRAGCIQPPTNADTVADGLRTFLGDVNFPIIKAHVSEILTVTEQGIIDAMRLFWERTKYIIEPSSAVPLAALFEHAGSFRGQRVGIVLSGGNVDLDHLPWSISG